MRILSSQYPMALGCAASSSATQLKSAAELAAERQAGPAGDALSPFAAPLSPAREEGRPANSGLASARDFGGTNRVLAMRSALYSAADRAAVNEAA